jgi:hypothetical protein
MVAMNRDAENPSKSQPLMVDRLTKESWPTDRLFTELRTTVTGKVERFIVDNSALCDPMDLRQQTLFRLTTFRMDELFKENALNENLVNSAISEQYRVIKNRLEKSTLPLEELLGPTGLFSERGWRIERDRGTLCATNHETTDKVALEFHEVDLAYAKVLFRDLHYIHSGRAEIALGLFVAEEEVPFSTMGITRVDRYYKHLALFAQGYNSANCWNVTRLYSRPNSPMNTSSMMFAKTVSYLRAHYPQTEAALTAFTPSFATGKSMVAGGFDAPILSTPLKLTFGNPTGLGFERLTSRRAENYTGEVISSKLPLLPVIHLMRQIRKPAQALPENSNKMLVLSEDTEISGFLRR